MLRVWWRGRLFRTTAAAAAYALVCGGVGAGLLVSAAAPAGAASRAAAPAAAPASAGTDVTARPDLVSARLTAREEGHRVEVSGLETADTSTFVNPDGSFTSVLYSGPVRVRRGSGWVPVDATLAANSDGSFSPKAAELAARLSGGGGGDSAVLTSGADSIGLGLPASGLPKPTASGATLTYANVEPGVDLIETVRDDGMEYSLRLDRRPTAPVSFTIPLKLTGLTVSQDATTGVLHFKDSAGRTVFDSSVPTMYGAAVDPHSDLPTYSEQLANTLVSTPSGPALQVSPNFTFLSNPAVTYPVTIDPSTTLGLHAATYVSKEYPTSSYFDASELRVGTYNGGTDADRAFWWFHTTPIIGKYVTSATLQVYEDWSYSCTPEQVNLWEMNAFFSSSTDWDNQPGGTKLWTSATAAKGYDSSCPAGNLDFDVTGLMQKYSGISTDGVDIGLSAASETNDEYWKKFQTTTNLQLSVTYDSYPDTPTNLSPASGAYYGSATADMSAKVTDPDGGNVQGVFYLQDTDGDVWIANGGYGSSVASGGTTSYSHGGLTNGHTYRWEVKAYDGTVYSGYTGWQDFTVDTTVNPAPTITSTTYSPGVWYASAGSGSNDFSWSDTSSDLSEWQYSEDDQAWTPTSATSLTWNPSGSGLHTLSVREVNKAGVAGTAASFSFGIGSGSVTSPKPDATTQGYVTLTGTGPSGDGYANFEFRRGDTGAWAPIPAAEVGLTGGTWYVAATNGVSSPLNWNVAGTVAGDGPVEVNACFYTDSTGDGQVCAPDSAEVTFTLNRDEFGASFATTSIGPGELSLLTGNYQVAATDGSVHGLDLSRTFDSLTPTDTSTGWLGPGWDATLPNSTAGADYQNLTDNTGTADDSDSIVVTKTDGTELEFTRNSATATAATYLPVGSTQAAGYSLSVTRANSLDDSFTLISSDGTQIQFEPPAACGGGSGGTPGVFDVCTVTTPGTDSAGEQTTSYVYDSAGRPIQVFAQAPDSSITCNNTSFGAGCRALYLYYNGDTTHSGGTASCFNGMLCQLSYRYADNTGNVSWYDLAAYAYNSYGQLASVTDLRSGLTTGYAYASSVGPLASLTPPGQAAWQFGYTGDQLQTVSRTHNGANGGGTLTWGVSYNVPTSSTSLGLPDLSGDSTGIGAWDQTDAPVTGTAIFGPGHQPASYTAPTTAEYQWATIDYIDVNGEQTNTASYGGGANLDGSSATPTWQVDSTEYDQYGNVTRSLTAANRDSALALGGGDESVSAAQADQLASYNYYNSDDSELEASYGPVHEITEADGSLATGRTHTVYGYDANAPNGDLNPATNTGTGACTNTTCQPYGLQTSMTVGAYIGTDHPAPGTTGDGTEVEDRSTDYDYTLGSDASGWALGEPLETVVDPGGLNITSTASYDDEGRQITSVMPKGNTSGATENSGDAYTSDTIYYTADGSTDGPVSVPGCQNAPAYAGQVCQTGPAGQPSDAGNGTTPGLPTTTTEAYDAFDHPLETLQTVTDQAGNPQTRTSWTAYNPDGQTCATSVADTSGDTQVQPTGTVYDSSTGLATQTGFTTDDVQTDATTGSCPASSTLSSTITQAYDDFGEPTSYTDATGATTTTSYNTDGQVASVADPHGTSTYTYDENGEHRGLVTSMTDTAFTSGTSYTAAYDGDGNLAVETYPNGLVATTSRDATDTPTELAYTVSGQTGPLLDFQNGINAAGEVITASSPESSQLYAYDNAGRLTGTQDSVTSAGSTICTVRSYTYDADTNRASYTNNPGTDATCPTSGGTTASNSVDAADRLTNTGYTYDAWGRTTTVPAADTGGTGNLSVSYYANDMVAGMIQNGQTMSWNLDPAGRPSTFADSGGGVHTEHFDGNGDSPLWTDNGSGDFTRNVPDIAGSLSAIQDQAGTSTLQLGDLHGDIVAQMSATTTTGGISAYFESTEFGIPRTPPAPQYAWLGGSERSSDALGGLVLMGVRLYDPANGRFLQTDPIAGGSANRYDYASQDPINNRDLSGQSYWRYCGSCAYVVPEWAWYYSYIGPLLWGPWQRAERWLFDNWYTTIKRYASYLDPGLSATPVAMYSQYGYSHNILKAYWAGHWYEDSQWEYYYRAYGVISFDWFIWHLFDLTIYIPGSFDNYTERDYDYVH